MADQMSLDVLRLQPEYIALYPQQQQFCEAYLETGNKLESAKRAYRCTSRASTRVMACMVFSKPKVIACLAVANGGDPARAKFDADLHRAIRNPKTTRNQVAALRLFAQTKGYLMPKVIDCGSDEAPPTKFVVGQRVTQRDDNGVVHTGIVRAIDADGVPSEIETIE